MVRIYLAAIGCLYLALALWCAIEPEQTSAAVGFTLRPGSGQSEFLAVYGGLEFALALAFLWPLYRKDETRPVLRFCVVVHACLVAFRSAGFLLFSGIGTTTYGLAATEWLVFLTGLACLSRLDPTVPVRDR